MAIPAGRNFAGCYMELCKRQRLRPLPVICATLPHSLNFTTDRVKMDDWGPILNSLSLDRSLRSIGIHSRYQCRKPLEEVNSEDKARAMGKAPVVVTRYLIEWLSQSVGQCVRNSSSLTHLELEGIPFPSDCVAVLCVGLSRTKSLHHLSLRRCFIGDAGCELVCRAIADTRSVRSLNLSHCDLTAGCGGALATALSKQKLSLYHDTWKQSLRYREPDLATMPGLRRLTLNDNPRLGDDAVRVVLEAIHDSLWLKALDLQRCGLTDEIGADLLELLDQNRTLAVLDVRKNVNLNQELACEVMGRLKAENESAADKLEYKWIGLPPKSDQRTASATGTAEPEAGENDEAADKIARPRGAYARQAKKRPSPRPPAPPTKMTIRPSSPSARHAVAVRPRFAPKVSLHLDLRPRLQSAVAASRRTERDEPARRLADEADATTKSPDSRSTVDVATQSVEEEEYAEMRGVLERLDEAREVHERLLDETRRADLLLAEEKARREAVETDLRSAQNDVAELESALRKKEDETRGYLLVSQHSLDEIFQSFDRLLEMLESATASQQPAGQQRQQHFHHQQQQQQQQQQISKAEIERRLASVIRQTKSENLKKRERRIAPGAATTSAMAAVDDDDDDSARKFAKSESDVRSTAPIPAARLETRIGECPENDASSPCRRRQRHRHGDNKPMSPGERARAIFASIVSGDAVFDLY